MIKKVQFFILLLGFILAVSGCATNKNKVTYKDFELTAKSVPEGILLALANIPSDTNRLEIRVTDKNPKVHPDMYFFGYEFVNAEIIGISLELVKKTGKILIPFAFVHTGHEYEIIAGVSFNFFEDGINHHKDHSYGWIIRAADIIAENGNYYDNYLELIVNESRTAVTLSSEPVFPAEIQLNPYNYSFGVLIKKENEAHFTSFPPERNVDGKHWEFVSKLTKEINLSLSIYGRLEKGGNYPTLITEYCNVTYDNISWNVEIARSPLFIYSHKQLDY